MNELRISRNYIKGNVINSPEAFVNMEGLICVDCFYRKLISAKRFTITRSFQDALEIFKAGLIHSVVYSPVENDSERDQLDWKLSRTQELKRNTNLRYAEACHEKLNYERWLANPEYSDPFDSREEQTQAVLRNKEKCEARIHYLQTLEKRYTLQETALKAKLSVFEEQQQDIV